MTMIYRVNAGVIPKDTWIQDIEIGGGRVIGEACHFIDYLTFMNGSLPKKISAQALPDPEGLNDTLNIMIQFENGSNGVIAYYANGASGLAKEYIEVYYSGTTAIINDFKTLRVFGKKSQKKKLLNQNKGQTIMIRKFINSLLDNQEPLISLNEIFAVTEATFAVIDSIKKDGKQITI